MIKTTHIKPGTSFVRTLHNPYVIPFSALLTMSDISPMEAAPEARATAVGGGAAAAEATRTVAPLLRALRGSDHPGWTVKLLSCSRNP